MKSVRIIPLVNSVAELAGDFDAHVIGGHEFPAVNVQAFAECQRRGQNWTSGVNAAVAGGIGLRVGVVELSAWIEVPLHRAAKRAGARWPVPRIDASPSAAQTDNT